MEEIETEIPMTGTANDRWTAARKGKPRLKLVKTDEE